MAAIVPLIEVLTSAQTGSTFLWVDRLPGFSDAENLGDLRLQLTFIFVLAVLCSSATRVSLLWTSTRLGMSCGSDISRLVYTRAISQPYEVQIDRNSSEVLSNAIWKTNGVVTYVILPFVNLVSASVLIAVLSVILILIDPMIAFSAVTIFGVFYLAIARLVRPKLRANSLRVSSEQTSVIKLVQEGLGGIRDVLLKSRQPYFARLFGTADSRLRQSQASNYFLSHLTTLVLDPLHQSLSSA